MTHVVIVGDIFDYASPSTAARYAFERGLRVLADKQVILVSGNHETPRATETMHPLSLYQDRLNVTVVIDPESVTVGDFRVIPWQWGQPITAEDLESDAPILVVHAACPVLEDYSREGARDFLPSMGDGYKYVALGDYHVPAQVAPNAWYSGSLEHTSFAEADISTGGWIVTLKDDGSYSQEYMTSQHRRMVNIHVKEDYVVALVGLTAPAAMDRETMYRIILHGTEPTEINPLQMSQLKNAAHFVKIVFQDRPEPPALVDFGPQTILDQWETFVEHAEYGSSVFEAGVEILEEAIADGR